MLIEEIISTGKFTQPQLELLRMFSKQYPEKVWLEIRDLLARFFMEKASAEMDNLFEQKGWGEEKINEWATEHMRTPYTKIDE
jgi:hypothetical protein